MEKQIESLNSKSLRAFKNIIDVLADLNPNERKTEVSNKLPAAYKSKLTDFMVDQGYLRKALESSTTSN